MHGVEHLPRQTDAALVGAENLVRIAAQTAQFEERHHARKEEQADDTQKSGRHPFAHTRHTLALSDLRFRKYSELIQNFTPQVARFVHLPEPHAADRIDPRPVVGSLHPAVVARVAEHHAAAHRAFEQHRVLRAFGPCAEGAVQPGAQRLQLPDTARGDRRLHLAGRPTAGVPGRSEKGKICR